jgi:hypothetical protein|tara:strand:+ start:94 stop:549 length:456 start_codon:yes stop_codon:yes gene_type:complete
MIKRRSKKKGPVRAKKVSYDGIDFASGLEKRMYLALKENNLFDRYEGEVFQLIEGFALPNISIEKTGSGKGEYKNRGSKKVLGVKYTPDFTGVDYIIETKGRANESFPIRYKLFKRWLVKNKDPRSLYKPQNQKDIEETIRLIIKNRNGNN